MVADGAGPDSGFRRAGGELLCEGVRLSALAQTHGTPLYVLSAAHVRARVRRLREAFSVLRHAVHYAVKANGSLALLRLLAEEGVGFDVVSGGELGRLAAAGIDAGRVVFAGVGKEEWEIREGLSRGILLFNVESAGELERIAGIARSMGTVARVALRLNPGIEAGTHPYVATGREGDKFGVDLGTAARLARSIRAMEAVDLAGYHFHLGSTLGRTAPYLEAARRVLAFMDGDPAHRDGIRFLDLGGGFGVRYRDEEEPDLPLLARELAALLAGRELDVLLEPGRWLVAQAGCLLTRVLYRKEGPARRFLVVDAGMNDLLRPSLYGAWHPIEPVVERQGPASAFDVVGPVCESADFLGLDREMADPQPGDLLAVLVAGAYGASMASNYNSRRRAAEVMVDGTSARLSRRRETFEDLLKHEVFA